MHPRGKFKPKGKRKQTNFKKNQSKFKNKPKKSFSLYQNNSKKQCFSQRNNKRKHEDAEDYKNEKFKKAKEILHNEPALPEESSSEDEEEDNMKQLRATFGNVNNKKSLAIDSSSESNEELSDEEEEADPESNEFSEDNKSVEDEASEEESDVDVIDNDNDDDDDHLDEYEESNVEDEEHENDLELGDSDEESNDASDLDDKTDESNNSEEDLDLEDISDENVDDITIQLETNEDDTNADDPFAKHILYDISDSLLNSVQSNPMQVDNFQENWPQLGKLFIQIPKCELPTNSNDNQFSICEKKIYAPAGAAPQRIHLNKTNLSDLYVKSQIVNNIGTANVPFNKFENKSEKIKIPLTPLQAELYSIMLNYQDLYYPQRTFENAEEIRFVYCLHAFNHILKTRIKVLHHNARLKNKDDVPEEFRDQGLVRPKILFIVPFRDAAYRIIQMLIAIFVKEDKGNIVNKKRFLDEFTGGELIMPKKNPKPEDYELLFNGNSNDDFKIGITLTKKSLKLYADFYSSDIIIASPLGLRCVIGAEGESERDYDFLASIELLILDQAEVFLMQNWDHLLHVFNHLHMQPKDSHGTDFARVRTWSLNGWAKFYRQTVIISSLILPEINSIFNKKCHNYAGKVKVVNPVSVGSISQVFVQMPHVYHKFEPQNVSQAIDARFNFFISKVLPSQKDTLMKQTLIYVANYFDYVRLRNYFKKEDIGFVQICEYSKDAKIARARDMFYHGDAHFLLYTERYHFFNRKRIKGVRHLVFYQPPNFPHFYYEMCNLMQEANMNKKVGGMSNMTVTILYSKYDLQQLSSIVGTERAVKMVSSDRNVHMLLTN